VADRTLASYEPVFGPDSVSQLRQLAAPLRGLKIVHVNSTRQGGGVAEILDWLIPLKRDLGLDASWEVVEGRDEYFKTTKSFHNGLQGNAVALTPAMIEAYESTVRANSERLRPKLEEADFVFIHDPQPAFLLPLCPDRRGRWVWRCHVDVSRPARNVWTYLRGIVSRYDASIFSMPEFAQPLPHPQFIIAPSIDPLSPKNRELGPDEIESARRDLGLPENGPPIVAQVSRYDRFKDPLGVIEAFQLVRRTVDAVLVLAGGGAADDPEGEEVLLEVRRAAEGDPNIRVLLLPPDAHLAINALQRISTIVLQKSLKEGFGLTVTEALWKGKPVIGGNVGGIRLQVHNYHTGFLVETPEGAALRMRWLLRDPGERRRMGETARRFVAENFLLNRHLREYLTLMLAFRRGLADHLLAQ
jgi:trehalose synthase